MIPDTLDLEAGSESSNSPRTSFDKLVVLSVTNPRREPDKVYCDQ